MNTDLENAERVVNSALSIEKRVPKCVLITMIEQHCGVSRRVATNLLVRLIAQGCYVDLHYDLMLLQDPKKAIPPSTEKKEEKIKGIPIHSIVYLSTIYHTYLLLFFVVCIAMVSYTLFKRFIPHLKVI